MPPNSLEEARYRIVESLDREDLSALAYVAEHDEGHTSAVLSGTDGRGQVAIAGALLAAVSHRTGVDVERVAHDAVKAARETEIGKEEDI